MSWLSWRIPNRKVAVFLPRRLVYLRENVHLRSGDALLDADRPARRHDAVQLVRPIKVRYIS